MNKLNQIKEKIKSIKHWQIYLVVILALIIVGIYFLSIRAPVKNSPIIDENQETFSSSQEYVDYLENKLESVLESVKGAGRVNVVLTLESGFEYVYVTEEETRTTNSGSITTNKLVLVDGKPVLEKEIFPVIKGVVVVAKGANDVSVKLNLLTAIQTVIEIDNSKITILAGN